MAANRPRVAREGRGVVYTRFLLTGVLGGVVGLEMWRPGEPTWLHLPMVDWVRWIGAPVGAMGLTLLWFTHHALGREFSTTLTVRPGGHLVTWGPYGWVRHPMYVAYLAVFVGAGLLTANWAITAIGTTVIGMLMSVRLRREEAMLLESYGEQYEEYSRRVPRFVPGLRQILGRVGSGQRAAT